MIEILKIIVVVGIFGLVLYVAMNIIRLTMAMNRSISYDIEEEDTNSLLQVWTMIIVDDSSLRYKTRITASIRDFEKQILLTYCWSTTGDKELRYDDVAEFLEIFSINEKLTCQFLQRVQ